MDKKAKVLFLCTGDPSRGGMAEGFLRKLAGDAFISASAGVEERPVSPLAVEVMKEVGVDISTQHSKSTAEALRERFAFVVSVADSSKERNPIFPFAFKILNWNLEDPEEPDGLPSEQLSRFRQIRDRIERHVRDFLAAQARDPNSTIRFAH